MTFEFEQQQLKKLCCYQIRLLRTRKFSPEHVKRAAEIKREVEKILREELCRFNKQQEVGKSSSLIWAPKGQPCLQREKEEVEYLNLSRGVKFYRLV